MVIFTILIFFVGMILPVQSTASCQHSREYEFEGYCYRLFHFGLSREEYVRVCSNVDDVFWEDSFKYGNASFLASILNDEEEEFLKNFTLAETIGENVWISLRGHYYDGNYNAYFWDDPYNNTLVLDPPFYPDDIITTHVIREHWAVKLVDGELVYRGMLSSLSLSGLCKYKIPSCYGILASLNESCGTGYCQSEDICICDGETAIGSNCDEYSCFGEFYPDSCSGNGNCTELNICECYEGYTHEMCQSVLCNGIANNETSVCSGHGTCIDVDKCECDGSPFKVYDGIFCEYAMCHGVSDEYVDVCSGNGDCDTPNNCTCYEDYYGVNCQDWDCYNILSTEFHVCSGSGFCVSPNNCSCDEGYNGIDCSYFMCYGISEEDTSSVCRGNGTCVDIDECLCHFGYGGDECNEFMCFGVLQSSDFVCSSHGSCIGVNHCTCDYGYTSNECEFHICFNIAQNETSKVCSGHGSCIGIDTCSCTLPFQWGNEMCQDPICFGIIRNDTNVCNQNGECVGPNNCSCHHDYEGNDCSSFNCYGIESEESHVCSYSGDCVAPNECQCHPGHAGSSCELLTCYGIPQNFTDTVCSGHGTCNIAPDYCVCEDGYKGLDCSQANCRNYWEGLECDICPMNFNISSDCDSCNNAWLLPNCTKCTPNYNTSNDCIGCINNFNISTSCTSCLSNFDVSSECRICLNGYIGSFCDICPGHYIESPGQCSQCRSNWDIDTKCTTCKNGWIGADCEICPPFYNQTVENDCSSCMNNGFDLLSNCSVCKINFNITSNCAACLNGWEGLECNECPENFNQTFPIGEDSCSICRNEWGGFRCETCREHFNPYPDCTECLNNWEGNNCSICNPPNSPGYDCQQCPGHLTEPLCLSCRNHWIGLENDCDVCPGNWNPLSDCSVCSNQWIDENNNCTTCPGNWDVTLDCDECVNGFYGDNCEDFDCFSFNKDDMNNTCSGNGLCTSPNNCTCHGLYFGESCAYYLCNMGHFYDTYESTCYECPSGYYSDEYGVLECSKMCLEGYYCKNGSINEYGWTAFEMYPHECSGGYYCTNGSVSERGHTHSNGYTNSLCAERYYCSGGNVNEFGDGICDDGYVCPIGSTNSTMKKCPRGHYCQSGFQNVCEKGYYSPSSGLHECVKCDKGTYSSIEGAFNCSDCEGGHYCPSMGSINGKGRTISDSFDFELKCADAYYCPPGSFTSQGAGHCLDGYYCPGGSSSPIESLCPPGFFCMNGFRLPCPKGEYNNVPSVRQWCILCSPGHFNSQINQIYCNETCYPGYACYSGSISGFGITRNSQNRTECEEGYFCPGGSENTFGFPLGGKCDDGYYCPPKSFRSDQELCPVGHYCLNGLKHKCPKGSFSAMEGVRSNCTLCPLGNYTKLEGSFECSLECESGYYCPEGSLSSHGHTLNDNSDKLCFEKHYCPVGSQSGFGGGLCADGYYCDAGCSIPTQNICPKGYYCTGGGRFSCPKGSYSNVFGESSEQCTLCDAGTYNAESARSTKCVEPCFPGFYCPGGSITLSGRTLNDTEDKQCSESYFCPQGSSNHTGFGHCEVGYYCPVGSISKTEIICPPGFYCILGMKYMCPQGYFCDGKNNEPRKCAEGYHCPNGTSINPVTSNLFETTITMTSIGLMLIISLVIIIIIFTVVCGLCCFSYYKDKASRIAPNNKELIFIFTDVLNSTELFYKYSDDMKIALDIHNEIIRKLVKKYKGFEVKTAGDSFFIVFKPKLVQNAISFATNVQIDLCNCKIWPKEILKDPSCKVEKNSSNENIYNGIRIRIGMHLGSDFKRIYHKESMAYDYIGNDINLTSRFEQSSSGGQILISRELRELMETQNMILNEVEGENFDIKNRKYFVKRGGVFAMRGVKGLREVYSVLPIELVERKFKEKTIVNTIPKLKSKKIEFEYESQTNKKKRRKSKEKKEKEMKEKFFRSIGKFLTPRSARISKVQRLSLDDNDDSKDKNKLNVPNGNGRKRANSLWEKMMANPISQRRRSYLQNSGSDSGSSDSSSDSQEDEERLLLEKKIDPNSQFSMSLPGEVDHLESGCMIDYNVEATIQSGDSPRVLRVSSLDEKDKKQSSPTIVNEGDGRSRGNKNGRVKEILISSFDKNRSVDVLRMSTTGKEGFF